MRTLRSKNRIVFLIILCLCLMTGLCACGKQADEKTSTAPADNSIQMTEQKNEGSQADAPSEITGSDAEDQTAPTATEGESLADVQDPDDEYSKVLVVYFSHTGTTRGVSEYLHEVVGGDLIEIEPVNPYPEGYSDALDPAKQEQRENARPEIANVIEHFDSYETIYLGYPIWWGTTPMIINTLLETYDFSGKTVVPYATSGGTGISQSIKDIRSEIPDADIKDGLLVKSNDDIIPWLQELGLYE